MLDATVHNLDDAFTWPLLFVHPWFRIYIVSNVRMVSYELESRWGCSTI